MISDPSQNAPCEYLEYEARAVLHQGSCGIDRFFSHLNLTQATQASAHSARNSCKAQLMPWLGTATRADSAAPLLCSC